MSGREPSRGVLPQPHSRECSGALTFLFVKWWQDAVVPAHFEVDFLLYAFGNGPLGNDDAHAGLDRAEHPAVAVEDAACCGHHCVPVVVAVVLQCAGAGDRVSEPVS